MKRLPIEILDRAAAFVGRYLLRRVHVTRAGKSFPASLGRREIWRVNLSCLIIKLQAQPNGNRPARSIVCRPWLVLRVCEVL